MVKGLIRFLGKIFNEAVLASRNPIVRACAIAFTFAIAVAWLIMTRSAISDARARLLSAASDIRATVNTCADNLLFYQGQAIVTHYRSPEAMTMDTIQELMARYGLDELNVVNSNGIVVAGALADIGFDMSSNPHSAKFNCLLAGAKTYSQDFRAPIENPRGLRRKYAGVAFPWPVKGYIQLGFSEKRLKHGIDFWFEDAAEDWHIGEHGYYVIVEMDTGIIKSCGRDEKDGMALIRRGIPLKDIGLDLASIPIDAHQFFEAKLFGENCLCLADKCGFHLLISVLPMSEIKGSASRMVALSAAILLVVFIFVAFFVSKLTQLVTSLREKERIEHELQERDLALAHTIQTATLPVMFPHLPQVDLFALMDTAREVGGDFYDFWFLSPKQLAVVMADVSGKGVPAAMFMMKAKAVIQTSMSECHDLAEAFEVANNRLAEANDAMMFVTCWAGVLDLASGTLTGINAGHNPPYVLRKNGTIEKIAMRSGIILAASANMKFRPFTVTLQPEDSFLLYTDGITEAVNINGDFYGEKRLEAALMESEHLPQKICYYLKDSLLNFTFGADQADDITMLALTYHGDS